MSERDMIVNLRKELYDDLSVSYNAWNSLRGEGKANAIIEYRAKTKFKTIDEIKNVSGIGDKLYESIKADLIENGPTDTKNLKSKDIKKPTNNDKKVDNNSTKNR